METKKNKKADLENKKSLFFEIGMITVLLVMILVFDSSWEKTETALLADTRTVITEEDMILPNTPEEPQEIAPPVLDLFSIVDENFDIDETFKWVSADPNFTPTTIIYVKSELPDEEYVEEPDIIVCSLLNKKDQPIFPNGDFRNWVNKKLKYPEDAIANNVEGKVMLQFVVDVDGSVSNIKILKKADELLNEEAVRVVASSPKWTPGRFKGKTIRTVYNFPVLFKLN
jgi:protein TonB